jgi:hypothetical protein
MHPWEPAQSVRFSISLVLVFLCVCGIRAEAQDHSQESSGPAQAAQQGDSTITAVPNRPTFSTSAETVQSGVFEIEYGFEAADGHQNINGLLKFGLLKNLELRFANNPFERDAGISALGDSGAGLKYRFAGERGPLPTISILYNATLPTSGDDLGAAGVNHAVGILLSKDFGRHHVDFNENVEWRSRSSADGFDRDFFSALAYSIALPKRLGIATEIAGFSRVNATTPPIITILPALTFSVSSRLVLDTGCYFAVRGDLPRVTFFAGLTYSVADLYRALHPVHR